MGQFSQEEWHTIEALFAEAAQLSAGEAQAWLDAARVPQSFKNEVRALLLSQPLADRFVEHVVDAGRSLLQEPVTPGDTVDRYRVLEKIATGGMGAVYRAEDTILERQVALKFVHLHLVDDPTLKQRFLREARTASRVDHKNVCTIYEVNETAAGQPYMAMAFEHGNRLDQWRDNDSITAIQLLGIAIQLSEALAAVHAADIIHRDLKPANIIVDDRHQVKLIDFGISKPQDQTLTDTGAVVGTLAYMAPEQFNGGSATIQSDIWALALVLLELLVGFNPFQRDTTGRTIGAIRHRELPDPLQLVPNLPPPVADLIDQCLQLEPQHRPQHCDQLANRFRTLYREVLGSGEPQEPLVRPPAADDQQRTSTSISRAERRQVTALSLAFSTPTAEGQELLLQHLAPIQQRAQKVLNDFNAHIHRRESDCLLVFMGFPRADEHAAKKAVRCGLALQQSLERANREHFHVPELEIKIGIDTGYVIVMPAESGAETYQIVGETTRTVDALRERLPASGVVVSAPTFALTKKHFHCVPLGNDNDAHLVQADRSPGFIDNVGISLTPMIGRQSELAILTDYWQRATDGSMQVVELVGDAGIGKSRLVHELKQCIAESPTAYISECYSDAAQSRITLHPIINYLYRAIGEFTRQPGTLEEQREALKAYLGRFDLPLEQALPVFSRLLNLDDRSASSDDHEDFKDDTLQCLRQLCTTRARLQPFLLVFEDLHWADATTLEFINSLINTPVAGQLMVLMTRRPDYTAPFTGSAQATRLTLSNLTQRQCRKFLSHCLVGHELPNRDVDRLVDISDGNPLYLEEVSKTFVTDNCDHPVRKQSVPSSLQDMLLARVDRLGIDKGLLQLASVVGREFDFSVLRAIGRYDNDAFLHALLKRLVQSDIIHPVNGTDDFDSSYRFKHALIQEAVYRSLLTEERRRLHGDIARFLEAKYLDGETVQPQLLADHYGAAGDNARALPYWVEGGKRSLQLSAYGEAKEGLLTALRILDALPASTELKKLELELQLLFVQVLRALEGWTAGRIGEHYNRAVDLCEQLELKQEKARILFGFWSYYLIKLDLRQAHQVAQTLVQLADALADPDVTMQARIAMANTRFWQGQLNDSRRGFAGLVEQYPLDRVPEHIERYGQDPRVLVLLIDTLLAWLTGNEGGADSKMQQMLQFATADDHPFTNAIALQGAAWFEHHRSNWDAAGDYAKRLIELSIQYEFPFYHGVGLLFDGWATALRDPRANESLVAGLDNIDKGYDRFIRGGGEGRVFHSLKIWLKADALLAHGRIEQAQFALESGIRVAYECDEKVYLAELLRLKALCLWQQRQSTESNALLLRARQLCIEQGSIAFLNRIDQQIQAQAGSG